LSEQLQLRRGTAAQVAAFTGAAGETVVDTTNNRLVVNDGSTAGGWPAAKLAEVVTNARTAVADAAYSALTTDRMIAYTSITAARAVALSLAASFPTGTRLLVVDESGNCSATLTITLNRAGSDTINGATSVAINVAYGYVAIESNGSNAWTVIDQGYAPSLQTVAEGANGANLQLGVLEFAVTGLSGATVTAGTTDSGELHRACGRLPGNDRNRRRDELLDRRVGHARPVRLWPRHFGPNDELRTHRPDRLLLGDGPSAYCGGRQLHRWRRQVVDPLHARQSVDLVRSTPAFSHPNHRHHR
jgi:Major tropism determinant N-terminal domain